MLTGFHDINNKGGKFSGKVIVRAGLAAVYLKDIFLRLVSIATLCTFCALFAAPALGQFGLPPVSTEWEGPVIRQSGTEPPANAPPVLDYDGNGTFVARWAVDQNVPVIEDYFANYTARSVNDGATWSQPVGHPNPADLDPRGRLVTSISAGENNVWLSAVITLSETSPATTGYAIVRSTDGGQTWDELTDLTAKLPLGSGTDHEVRQWLVTYCGNSSWLALMNTRNAVRYVRSTDNGVTWGNPVTLQQNPNMQPVNLDNVPGSAATMIAYYDYGTSQRVVRFSYDNGATFGSPVLATTGGTDGAGNWVLAGATTASGIPLLHSTDNGQTFNPIPGPPHLAINYRVDDVVYSEAGEIVVVATATVVLGPSVFANVTGLYSRSGDLGQTWTPWKRVHDITGDPKIEVEANELNQFFAVFYNSGKLFSYELDLGPAPAAAADWQLFQ